MSIATGTQILASDYRRALGENGYLDFANATTLTLASGAVLQAQNWHLLDTEGAAARDDLDTITIAPTTGDGCLLFVKCVSTARVVVVKHDTGNIYTPTGGDVYLCGDMVAGFIYDATLARWVMIRHTNRGGGLIARQGGSATDWSATGTTTYNGNNLRVQVGAATIATAGTKVTFPVAFSGAPIIVIRSRSNTAQDAGYIALPTTTNFGVLLPAYAGDIHWIAIGPV